jgi:hypothetical protein
MNRSQILIFLVFLAFVAPLYAQKRRPVPFKKNNNLTAAPKNLRTAVVIGERLAILRIEPSLYSDTIQRMRMGRIVSISGIRNIDGLTFYRVILPPRKYAWVQAEAVISKNLNRDHERLFQLIQASDGFEKFERGAIYLQNFPDSRLRPAILLLLGDLAEEAAGKLSRDATRQLDKREMSASGAPLQSFYLSHSSLDRYRKIGINFWFNPETKQFHYDGSNWREIITKFPNAGEADEARKRLAVLEEKMQKRNE